MYSSLVVNSLTNICVLSPLRCKKPSEKNHHFTMFFFRASYHSSARSFSKGKALKLSFSFHLACKRELVTGQSTGLAARSCVKLNLLHVKLQQPQQKKYFWLKTFDTALRENIWDPLGGFLFGILNCGLASKHHGTSNYCFETSHHHKQGSKNSEQCCILHNTEYINIH